MKVRYEVERKDGDRGWSSVTSCPSLATADAWVRSRQQSDPSYPEQRIVKITHEVVELKDGLEVSVS